MKPTTEKFLKDFEKLSLSLSSSSSSSVSEMSTEDEFEVIEWEDATPEAALLASIDTVGINDEELAEKYIDFTNEYPTTYHVIDHFRQKLVRQGFRFIPEQVELDEDTQACLAAGGKFFTVRDGLSLVAFVLGGNWKPEAGLGGVACHVDALTAKIKASSAKAPIEGYNMLGVANYSGALSRVWLDRDLGVGGAVLVRQDGKLRRKLVKSSPHPIAKIPRLAEHFGSVADNSYNLETQMVPIVGFGEAAEPSELEKQAPLYGKHSLTLLRYVAKLAQVEVLDIVEMDLELYDVQPATRGGLAHEFIFAPRLDDRLCSFSAIEGLLNLSRSVENNLEHYDGLNLVCLVNNEEIGSATRTGAKGRILNSVVNRIVSIDKYKCRPDSSTVVFANSVLLSADVTHALNPNFKSAYLEGHSPVPNKGLVIKQDASMRVATDVVGVTLMKEIARHTNQQLQNFSVRNDGRSGSTIGPFLATDTGAVVVDVGLPILSMHSIRATCGFQEVGIGQRIFAAFFHHWRRLYGGFET